MKIKFFFSYKLLFFTMIFLIATSCAHYPLESHYNGPAPLPVTLKNEYSYKKFSGIYHEEVVKETRSYRLIRVWFPSTGTIIPSNHNINIDYYQLKNGSNAPVVMVLPILAGGSSITKSFADYFANHGMNAVIVHRNRKFRKLLQFDTADKLMRQIVLDHKLVMDWIETRHEIDSQKIGVFGISMGGIKAALISELDSRVNSSVIALASGDLPYLLTYSPEKRIRKKREDFMKRTNLNRDELLKFLSDTIECDPLNYAQHLNAEKTLMIIARFDKTVPYFKGKELKQRAGNPETIVILAGHYTAMPYKWYVMRKSLNFFTRKFNGL